MLAYLGRRLVLALLTIWAVSVLSFVVIQLPPGDYISSYIAQMSASGSFVSAQEADALRQQYGLDKPVYIQYIRWMRLVVQGKFRMALAGTAQLTRIMRANRLDGLRKPYVVSARARGLSERRVILKYPVRVALNPFASTVGYLLPYVVSGSIIVSLVLSLPTVGPLLLRALVAQDMFLAGTIVLLLGVMTVVGTFLSDLLLMWIDPRIRLEGRK